MSKRLEGEWLTPKISRVWTAANAEGRTSLVFETSELGPIAIELTQEKIDLLREQLALAEQVMNRPQGSA